MSASLPPDSATDSLSMSHRYENSLDLPDDVLCVGIIQGRKMVTILNVNHAIINHTVGRARRDSRLLD